MSDKCRDLLLRLLTRDPNKRIAFDDFFTHPFLDLKHAPSDSSLPKAVSIGNTELQIRRGNKDNS